MIVSRFLTWINQNGMSRQSNVVNAISKNLKHFLAKFHFQIVRVSIEACGTIM